jgi:hypothetical protein
MEPMHPVKRRACTLAFRHYLDRNPDDTEGAQDYAEFAWWQFDLKAMEDLGIPDDEEPVSEEELELRLTMLKQDEDERALDMWLRDRFVEAYGCEPDDQDLVWFYHRLRRLGRLPPGW